jgi:hypothetical protein
MYSGLDTSIDASGRTVLSPPRRLWFPRIPTFSDLKPKLGDLLLELAVVRTRSPTGFHPYLTKVAFPGLGVMYKEDWNDYQSMQVPFVLERVVIADRGAAAEASSQRPVFAGLFEDFEASAHWFEPIRKTLALSLDVEDGLERERKRVVTYLSAQDESPGLILREDDHNALVDALKKMGRRRGYEVNIVTSKTKWVERMSAIARSTV